MNSGPDRLEHLFSRILDGECTADERELFDALRADQPEVARRFDEYRQLDQAAGDALRAVMNCPPRPIPIWTRLRPLARTVAFAAAACLAILLWLYPPQHPGTLSGNDAQQASALAGRSWFGPTLPQADTVSAPSPTYVRPQLQVRNTDRDWIVIPGDGPREYFVIEVDRVQEHVIVIHKDL